ncbi:MAG: 4-alpha-glucanotransferase [Clostridia bacterium]|nr:4-alpha-glucanotransferase [Clostridia bacterium]
MRKCGILLPITALPSHYGIGCFSHEAYEFVDFLQRAGQSYWQILPLGPTSVGDSPYQSFSTFAGNPYFVDLEGLIKLGLLTKEECDRAGLGTNTGLINYQVQYKMRIPLLKKAHQSFTGGAAYHAFVGANRHWLADYALFMALKEQFEGAPWHTWPEDLRNRKASALVRAGEQLAKEVDFWQFVQFTFFTQWQALKVYANQRGVAIIGDLPIYVSHDSADVWANPSLFRLTTEGLPTHVAGCPPDGFSKDGQLWGNPLYRWEYHKQHGYDWWRKRLAHALSLYDVVRLDHFRGFESYYAIPFGHKTARHGRWEKGPGKDLFEKTKNLLGTGKIIAEDLGFITPAVEELLKNCGFPGMKVLQFAFDARDGDQTGNLPHGYPSHTVAYTGTHDNQTLVSWFATISPKEQQQVRTYLGDTHTPNGCIYKPLIARLLATNAKLCIIPLQDYLGLTDTARINTPSTLGNNWQWRVNPTRLTRSLQKEIYTLTKLYDRL